MSNPSPALPPARNRLLAGLPANNLQRLAAHLEEIPLHFGQVLHDAGEPITHVYFPNSGAVSIIAMTSPMKGTQVGMFGSDGLVGMSAVFGTGASPLRAVVQDNGTAMRMLASRLRTEVAASTHWHHELLRFSTAMLAQASQTAACNRYHTIEERLGGWLLAMRDRTGKSDFARTQSFLALMLGVRRVGITLAVSTLETQGLVSSSRGHIHIVNARGLEKVSCGCFRHSPIAETTDPA